MAIHGDGPERDRRLANKPRYGYRKAKPLREEIEQLIGSETFRKLKRFQRVNDALKVAIGEKFMTRIRPVSAKAGTLVIEVADSPLLAELKQHYHYKIINALSSAGTGISRVQYRIGRRKSTIE